MARKKKDQPSEWIGASKATQILSEKAGRPIHESYIRVLVKKGKIEARQVSGNANQYKRSDVEGYVVKSRSKKTTIEEHPDEPEAA